MDAFSALSVATSAVQFVDFTTKLVAGTHEIYASSSGETRRNSELRGITDSLIRLNRGLEKSLSAKNKSPTDAELVPLCQQCNEVAEILIDALKKLSVHSKSRMWASFHQALKSIWNQAEIDQLQHRLDSFRQQLSIHLLVTIRQQVAELGKRQEDSNYQTLRDTQHKTEKVLDNFDTGVEFREDIVRLIYDGFDSDTLQPNMQFTDNMKQYLPDSEIEMVDRQLIHQLGYHEKNSRFEDVAMAHKETFEWLFHSQSRGNRTWSDFLGWLQDPGDQMYWITGKPGSGKSTLMKFIWGHEKTGHVMHQWAAGSSISTASFFFWNSGSRIQMAHEGLLRKLLYDLLQQHPDMASVIFAHRLEERILFSETPRGPQPWRWKELLQAFKALLTHLTKDSKVFFVIDGLDEFDGDPQSMIAFVESLRLIPNVKICVSSRPWIMFEDAFSHRPSLRLEDLTENDIRIYVTSKLSANPGYHTLAAFDLTYANRLIENVTTKASGVFLWVYLVVQSLEEGLTEGERLSDLQRRLDSLPQDLENLFHKMLKSLGPVKFQRATRLLRLVRAAIIPVSLVNMSYADEDDVEYIFSQEVKPLSSAELLPRAELMRRRLNACCKGLIEPKSRRSQADAHAPVGYLHRTVKDFLEQPRYWEQITVEPFNADLHLCVSHLAMMKADAASDSTEETLWSLINFIIEYLARSDIDESPLYPRLLDELDRTADAISKSSRATELRRRTNSGEHWTTMSLQFRTTWEANFRHFAVQCQLLPYIKHALKERRSDIRNSELCSLLWCATTHYVTWGEVDLEMHQYTRSEKPAVCHDTPNLTLIEILLEYGANPNGRIDNQTIWQHVLGHTYMHPTKEDIMALFLEYGANPRESLISLRIPDESSESLRKLIKQKKRSSRVGHYWQAIMRT